MRQLNRRDFLKASGLTATGALLAACQGGTSGANGGGKQMQWWDHFRQLQDLHKKIFEEFAGEPNGRPVKYTYVTNASMGEKLQLAHQSNGLPDVHTLAGLKFPVPALVSGDWFTPIQLDDEALSRVEDRIVDGITRFDKKVYSFPIFATKQYESALWYFADVVEKAGLDPDNPPRTYDEFRSACRKVKKSSGGKVQGWMTKLGGVSHFAGGFMEMAQAAGFGGSGLDFGVGSGVDFRTGEYSYHSEYHMQVVEFLQSMVKDKLIFEASLNVIGNVSMARWRAGSAAFFFDGPWNPGGIRRETPQLLDKLRVAPMLVPEAGTPVTRYARPKGGALWISSQSKIPEVASRLLSEHFTTPEYSRELATAMDQPPADLTVVDKADVAPPYKTLCQWYRDQVFIAPVPVVKNLAVVDVISEMKPVNPKFGVIMQGVASGDVTNPAKALKSLSDKTSAERERALKAARKKGKKVSLDDWTFPNWQPRKDFTESMYR